MTWKISDRRRLVIRCGQKNKITFKDVRLPRGQQQSWSHSLIESCWLLLLLCSLPAPASAFEKAKETSRIVIATWGGDDPEWVSRMGVNQIRIGCNLDPATCIKRGEDALKAEKTQSPSRFSLSFNDDTSSLGELVNKAKLFAKYAPENPGFYEVSLDDFLRRSEHWPKGGETGGLLGLRKALEPKGRVALGLTLYEDDLQSSQLKRLGLDERSQVDTVYLYLHYRKNAANYSDYVERARALFPNARLIGGVYAYDRIEYLRCKRWGISRCTVQEELQLFEQVTRVQIELIKKGKLVGLEFYPGHFGREDQWPAWAKPRICSESRRSECIANTRKLRELALKLLQESGIVPQVH